MQYKSDSYWYMQERLNLYRFIIMGFRAVLRVISGGRINLNRPLEYKPMRISFLNEQQFYEKAGTYINNFLKCMGIEEKNIILDQLLLPHNIYRAEKYFDDRMECFVVNRDPRDVFILNKYIWPKVNETVPFPTEVNEFCGYYRGLRSIEKKGYNLHVHMIQFEELIYNYEYTLKKVMKILKLDETMHSAKKQKFNPEKSINNTQLFIKDEYKAEASIIEKNLSEFLYDFPYANDADVTQSF